MTVNENPKITTKCPECGCSLFRSKDAPGIGYRLCQTCEQEWWTDVDYSALEDCGPEVTWESP